LYIGNLLVLIRQLRYDVLQKQRKEIAMKTASIPSLRVDPELRQDAESVLREGETLSSFMEQALRSSIQSRRVKKEFIARGLISRDEAKRTSEYLSAEDVLVEMDDMLSQAEARSRK
jgi:hypothetical protein